MLNVLTARPGTDDLARVRHFLYGHVSPATAYSTGSWLRDVAVAADSGLFVEKPPIFVGGTGLYFRALAEGISEMPDIPTEIRDRWRWRLNEEGAPRLHRLLMNVDSAVAMRLKASDGQRIVRALEVLEASGRSILKWQADKGHPMIDLATARFIVIEPERELLITRIDARFDKMIELGALDEVKAITAMRLAPELPAMKAIGVRELASAMAGEQSFDMAIERAKIATRQYAKRQSTWFRNQFGPEWRRIGGEAGRDPGAADA
ncbi:tRNA dimethylallyltransferase [Aminobacter sp. AP02]|nr:tRNA dimethylallyltransferase [Aminobacter sp. AP02]